MSAASRADALLALVEDDCRRRCDAIGESARAQRSAILREAHAAARSRVRAAFADERARRDARLAAARANLETRRRIAANAFAAAQLDAGLARLPQALAARWRDEAARRAWIDEAVSRARAALGEGAWRIAHAPGWPARERDALAATLADRATTVAFDESAALVAGLRIAAQGNVVDATRDGLCADRDETGAMLLALLEAP